MAGVLKIRDAGGVLRTVTALKVRDGGGTLRTITSAKLRDGAGVLREVFNSGGGGGANPTSITPGAISRMGHPAGASDSFTASSSTTAPTSYSWGLLDGPGYVSGPTNTATAALSVYTTGGNETVNVTFYCDMVVGGTTYRATCLFNYTSTVS